MDYYNDNEPYAADWLERLRGAGVIPDGVVDRSSILGISPGVLKDARRVHLFAGIGGWAYALKLAGWPEDEEVWTGSCPCQPFSISGKKKGESDARHLWPAFRNLISKRRPAAVFGEQVAGPLGRKWLSGVRSDLEELGYQVGAADLCAASVGAPHRRQRIFWVAHRLGYTGRERLQERSWKEVQQEAIRVKGDAATKAGPWGRYVSVPCKGGKVRRIKPGVPPLADGFPGRVGRIRAYGNAIVPQVAARFIRAYLEFREEVARGRVADARRFPTR